jgi:hypothetical protein
MPLPSLQPEPPLNNKDLPINNKDLAIDNKDLPNALHANNSKMVCIDTMIKRATAHKAATALSSRRPVTAVLMRSGHEPCCLCTLLSFDGGNGPSFW